MVSCELCDISVGPESDATDYESMEEGPGGKRKNSKGRKLRVFWSEKLDVWVRKHAPYDKIKDTCDLKRSRLRIGSEPNAKKSRCRKHKTES